MKDSYARICLGGATILVCMAVVALLFGNSSSYNREPKRNYKRTKTNN